MLYKLQEFMHILTNMIQIANSNIIGCITIVSEISAGAGKHFYYIDLVDSYM